MTHPARLLSLLLLFGFWPLAAESSEYLLFSPHPLEGELLMPERGKGILVRRITIQRGDTLSQISRDFSGKGSYYPQILLFNNITNPDRIFAGKELMVPVSKQDALTKTVPEKKRVTPPAQKKPLQKPTPAEKPKRSAVDKPLPAKPLPQERLVVSGEQVSFAKAVSAFKRAEYEKALSLFNRFLERYPSSAMASDASLYKAECLLKLSGQ